MSSSASGANDGPQGRIAGFLSFLRNGSTRWAAVLAGATTGRALAEEDSPSQERVRALQDEPVRPQQDAACRRLPSSGAAVKHSIPHGVVSQVVSPEIASFMEGSRVVVRTHQDELCCVDTVEVVARDSALCTAVVECLGQFPHLVRLKFETAVVDVAVLAAVGNLSSILTSAAVTASTQQRSPLWENSLRYSISSSTAVAASMRQGSPRSETSLSYSVLTSAAVTAFTQQGSPRSLNSPSFSVLTSTAVAASIQ